MQAEDYGKLERIQNHVRDLIANRDKVWSNKKYTMTNEIHEVDECLKVEEKVDYLHVYT